MEVKGWHWVPESQLSSIMDPVQVFVRDPRSRFVSGVNTYLQHLQAEGNDLDQHTTLYFVNRYLFLNRHFAPQFFWLLNLARHVPNVQVSLCDLSEISQLTDRHSNGEIQSVTEELQTKIAGFDWSKLELYYYLDDILLEHRGKTVAVHDLIAHVYNQHRELYDIIFKPTVDLVNVLPKT
jgi:hypothetical protein